MSINPVSASSNSASIPQGSNDNDIKFLEKQKDQIKEQILKVNQSKMDSKAKQERVKQLNEQLEQLDTQIQQKKMEKVRQNLVKSESGAQNNTDSQNIGAQPQTDEYISTVNSKHMISAASTYSDMKTLGKVRTELKNQLRLATSSGENPEAGEAIADKIENVESDILKKSRKIDKDLKDAAKHGEKVQRKTNNIESGDKTQATAQSNVISGNEEIDKTTAGSIADEVNTIGTEDTAKAKKNSDDESEKGKVVDVHI